MKQLQLYTTFQSTLPRKERPKTYPETAGYRNFNPRSHARSDPFYRIPPHGCFISIHAPTQGATYLEALEFSCNSISIHAPTQGATELVYMQSMGTEISIHAPTQGATSNSSPGVPTTVFQSTLPRKERLYLCVGNRTAGKFQSTLPRKERRSFVMKNKS